MDGFWIVSLVLLALAIVVCLVSCFFSRSEGSLIRLLTIGMLISYWIVAFCTYACQKNPIIQPTLTLPTE
ncbi:ATPase, V0 complex, subunit e1/e2 like protein [Aduncisulcus paluster]|uniref:ATPase, V0 complex, subunit e1/e2 like protein n=1 Tax=Aduncisulcus paluster TaxID=2918883 RepID=A0ABQ5K5G0_9EUKA|nr:ATPase, V0 complex, subunit e1/e2 like protein [Aduncisulcus paluster]